MLPMNDFLSYINTRIKTFVDNKEEPSKRIEVIQYLSNIIENWDIPVNFTDLHILYDPVINTCIQLIKENNTVLIPPIFKFLYCFVCKAKLEFIKPAMDLFPCLLQYMMSENSEHKDMCHVIIKHILLYSNSNPLFIVNLTQCVCETPLTTESLDYIIEYLQFIFNYDSDVLHLMASHIKQILLTLQPTCSPSQFMIIQDYINIITNLTSPQPAPSKPSFSFSSFIKPIMRYVLVIACICTIVSCCLLIKPYLPQRKPAKVPIKKPSPNYDSFINSDEVLIKKPKIKEPILIKGDNDLIIIESKEEEEEEMDDSKDDQIDINFNFKESTNEKPSEINIDFCLDNDTVGNDEQNVIFTVFMIILTGFGLYICVTQINWSSLMYDPSLYDNKNVSFNDRFPSSL